ncbi:MAG: YggS family pyridoxal phosphate-dependent enzyme [Elusimicrobia bacterium]|nr:YggS family pyridoxal phosphate-dependent enzyme [Elusimicrobiota bacterium]
MYRPVLIDNLKKIRYRVRAAALRAGRDPGAVRLVAAVKHAPLASVRELLSSGLVAEVGENRVQDAERRQEELGGLAASVRWRLIGHLQTNKAGKAARIFDAVDSVDSEKIAAALDAALRDSSRILPVLAQVKLAGRATQSGVSPDALPTLLAALKKFSRLRVEGLMGIAPDVEPLEAVRPSFQRLRELRDRHLPGGLLSMGMSRDFEIAVEEGADMLRVGTLIFSQTSPASLEAPE